MWGDGKKMTQNKIDPDPEPSEFKYKKKARDMTEAPEPAPPLAGSAPITTFPR